MTKRFIDHPGQVTALKDETHFNNYGAYELARCVVEGIRIAKLPLAEHLTDTLAPFDPARPEPVEGFDLASSPLRSTTVPAGR